MKRVILVSLCFVLGICTVAFAGANEGVAKGVIHVRPHNAKLGCNVTITECSDIVTTEPSDNFDAFPVFYELVEFSGCEYGVTWPAWTYSAQFNNCSDLIIGAIVWPDEGVSHTWLACQTGFVCVPSWLWLYADGPGQVCITGHPEHGSAFVLDCAVPPDPPEVDVLIGWGCAGVYGATGHDPCGPLEEPATLPATWGQIKSLFQ